jgi:hypothetical protein
MTASVWHPCTAQKVLFALVGMLIGIMGTLHSASALTAEECYKKDSGCTQFCGNVTGSYGTSASAFVTGCSIIASIRVIGQIITRLIRVRVNHPTTEAYFWGCLCE